MNKYEALARVKYLVACDRFSLVNRRSQSATAVTSTLAKIIVQQLRLTDFRKYTADRDRPGEYLWIFKTDYGDTYYLKFKFTQQNHFVRFISFHLSD